MTTTEKAKKAAAEKAKKAAEAEKQEQLILAETEPETEPKTAPEEAPEEAPDTKVETIVPQCKTLCVKEDQVLVYTARRPLSERAFKLASNMLKEEADKAGLKIILIPASVELKEIKKD